MILTFKSYSLSHSLRVLLPFHIFFIRLHFSSSFLQDEFPYFHLHFICVIRRASQYFSSISFRFFLCKIPSTRLYFLFPDFYNFIFHFNFFLYQSFSSLWYLLLFQSVFFVLVHFFLFGLVLTFHPNLFTLSFHSFSFTWSHTFFLIFFPPFFFSLLVSDYFILFPISFFYPSIFSPLHLFWFNTHISFSFFISYLIPNYL